MRRLLLKLLPIGIIFGLIFPGARLAAEQTKLLEVDFQTGAHRRIDISGPKTAADRELDALLDKTTGGSSFSTDELEKIEKALRRYLAADRPRAVPRLLLFLYPGRISRNGLKELREIKVEVELVVDPCSRTICKDSVAKNIEILGKALKQSNLRAGRYTIHFMDVIMRTSTEMKDQELDVFHLSAEEVVAAGQRQGGGNSLMAKVLQAQESYGRQMTKEVGNRLRLRRVKILHSPRVNRTSGSVSLEMEIQTDRIRYHSDVLNAFISGSEALRTNPLTPSQSTLKVIASIPYKTIEKRIFECMGQPLKLLLDGRTTQEQIWSTYIVEKKKEGTQLTFDDEEARGGPGGNKNAGGAGTDDALDNAEERTRDTLAGHFNLFAPCLTTEANRNRQFKGVTLTFAISQEGKAVKFGLKEGNASGALKTCLQAGLSKIRFQKHSGTPRQVEYPMIIKR